MLHHEQMVLLRNYDLWADLTDEEYEEIRLIHRFIEAGENEYIYFEPAWHDKLFFLKEGSIKLGQVNESGEEMILEIIRKGEVFGQFTLARGNDRGEFAQAFRSDVSLCAFNVADFERVLASRPDLAIRYSAMVGQKLHRAQNRILNLLHRDVRSRLLGFIYNLAVESGYSGSEHSFSIENFLTHGDIARLIGSSRQTVTSLLNVYQSAGLLEFDRKHIHLKDVKNLLKSANVSQATNTDASSE